MSTPKFPVSTDQNPVHVYEWKAWPGYLFPSIFTNAIRIEAKLRQSNTDILKKLVVNRGYFLFHLNLTKTAFFFKNKEELLIRLKNAGITTLNAEINDISKQYLQSVCAQIDVNTTRASVEGDENELLITKTNFNHGGRPEKRLLRSEFRRLNLSTDDYNSDIIYPVMERKKIKDEVWKNENLVVEKYIANKEDYFFRIYILLHRIVISEVVNHDIIKKMTSGIQRVNYYYDFNNKSLPGGDPKFNDLVADIERFCIAFTLNFGAIDVVKSDEGKFYIIDVNVTPNWQNVDQTEILNFLAGGLSQTKTINLIEETLIF